MEFYMQPVTPPPWQRTLQEILLQKPNTMLSLDSRTLGTSWSRVGSISEAGFEWKTAHEQGGSQLLPQVPAASQSSSREVYILQVKD